MNVEYRSFYLGLQTRAIFECHDNQELGVRCHNRVAAFFLNIISKITGKQKITELTHEDGSVTYLNAASFENWKKANNITNLTNTPAEVTKAVHVWSANKCEQAANKYFKERSINAHFCMKKASTIDPERKVYFDRRSEINETLYARSFNSPSDVVSSITDIVQTWDRRLTEWEDYYSQLKLAEPYQKLNWGTPFSSFKTTLEILRQVQSAFHTSSCAEKPFENFHELYQNLEKSDLLKYIDANHHEKCTPYMFEDKEIEALSVEITAYSKDADLPEKTSIDTLRKVHKLKAILRICDGLQMNDRIRNEYDHNLSTHQEKVNQLISQGDQNFNLLHLQAGIDNLITTESVTQDQKSKSKLHNRITSIQGLIPWYQKYLENNDPQSKMNDLLSTGQKTQKDVSTHLDDQLTALAAQEKDAKSTALQQEYEAIKKTYAALKKFSEDALSNNNEFALNTLAETPEAILILQKLGFNLVDLRELDFETKYKTLAESDQKLFGNLLRNRIALAKLSKIIANITKAALDNTKALQTAELALEDLKNGKLQESITKYNQAATEAPESLKKEYQARAANARKLHEWAQQHKITVLSLNSKDYEAAQKRDIANFQATTEQLSKTPLTETTIHKVAKDNLSAITEALSRFVKEGALASSPPLATAFSAIQISVGALESPKFDHAITRVEQELLHKTKTRNFTEKVAVAIPKVIEYAKSVATAIDYENQIAEAFKSKGIKQAQELATNALKDFEKGPDSLKAIAQERLHNINELAAWVKQNAATDQEMKKTTEAAQAKLKELESFKLEDLDQLRKGLGIALPEYIALKHLHGHIENYITGPQLHLGSHVYLTSLQIDIRENDFKKDIRPLIQKTPGAKSIIQNMDRHLSQKALIQICPQICERFVLYGTLLADCTTTQQSINEALSKSNLEEAIRISKESFAECEKKVSQFKKKEHEESPYASISTWHKQIQDTLRHVQSCMNGLEQSDPSSSAYSSFKTYYNAHYLIYS